MATKSDLDGLARFHVLRTAVQHQILALLGGVQHVIAGHGIDGHRHAGQIDRQDMTDGHRVTGAALAGNGDVHRPRWPVGDVSRRYVGQPGAVGQHAGVVGGTVDGDHQLRPRRQADAGAADIHTLVMFDGVDDVITRHSVHTQARQIGVDHKVATAVAGIAVHVGHAGSNAQCAVAQGGQIGSRDGNAPAQIRQHRGGVGFAAQQDGNRIASSCPGHTASQRLAASNFCRVQHIVTGDRVEEHRRQCGIYLQAVSIADAVANAVGGAGSDGVVGFAQVRQVSHRHGNAPRAANHGGAVVDAVQVDGHNGVVRQVAGTAESQRLAFLNGVQYVVHGDIADGQRRRHGVHRHVLAGTAYVARLIGQGNRHRAGAVGQRTNHAGRYADTPVPRRVYRGGIALPVEGQHQAVPHRAAAGTGDDLRLQQLRAVEDVITGNQVDRHRWRGQIDQHALVGAGRVTRLIADAGGDIDCPVDQR
ncbi:hypothetical protein D3C76_833460 [compost metagenome]